MLRPWMHYLALGCGCLLALPPGWCCLLQQLAAKPAPQAAEPAPHPSCCGATPAPVQSSPAPERPLPRYPERCACADRQATMLDDACAAWCDLLGATSVLLVEPALALWSHASWAALPPTASPHLWNCVWLC